MLPNHRYAAGGKTLCGIFLSSVMGLSGCAGTAPQPPIDPKTGPKTSSNYDTTVTRVTGEENIKKQIYFAHIEQEGDPRIRRIITRLRKSSVGEEIYQFAVKNNIRFQWEKGHISRKGAYYFGVGLITIDVMHSDDGILSTLSHEMRHAWQDRTLGLSKQDLEPTDYWRSSQLSEADSCAFNAHFVANFKDETGYMLDLSNSFSASVSRAYTAKPRLARDYMRDGLEACLNVVLHPYAPLHMGNLRSYLSRSTQSFRYSTPLNRERLGYQSGINVLNAHQRSRLFMRMVNNTLDSETILPNAKSMGYDAFINWINDRTPFRNKEDEEESRQMDQNFRAMRQKSITPMR